MKTIDLFLKTYPTDYDWLPYFFKSIERYVTGFRNIVAVVEDQYEAPPNLPANAVVKFCRSYLAGGDIETNFGAAIERLRAWAYSDADVIIYVDSDCVFTRPVDLQTDPLIHAERPLIYYRPWDEAGPAVCWKALTIATLGFDPPYETMACYPATYPRSVLVDLWEHVGGEKRLISLKTPTDLNVMGNFALTHCQDRVLPGYAPMITNPCVRQFWSWDRAAAAKVQAELREYGL